MDAGTASIHSWPQPLLQHNCFEEQLSQFSQHSPTVSGCKGGQTPSLTAPKMTISSYYHEMYFSVVCRRLLLHFAVEQTTKAVNIKSLVASMVTSWPLLPTKWMHELQVVAKSMVLLPVRQLLFNWLSAFFLIEGRQGCQLDVAARGQLPLTWPR